MRERSGQNGAKCVVKERTRSSPMGWAMSSGKDQALAQTPSWIRPDQVRLEQARRRLTLLPQSPRRRTVNRLDKIEVERLIQNTDQFNKYGLMIKTLFLSGAPSR